MGAHVRQGKARTSKKMAMLARKRPSWSQIAAPVKGRWGRRAIVQISKDTSCALCCAGKTQLCNCVDISTVDISTYRKMLICRHVDCRLIAKLSPIIKNHHFIPNPPKVSKQVFPRWHPNTGLVGTFICNKIQTILMKRTLISCTQTEKVAIM